jgi:uncharacterized membrane protein YoaK (UPF0700 family)
MCLALIAGYVDAYGLTAFGTYVSFMSGNTTQVGSMTGHGRLVEAMAPALAILFFVWGSCSGTYLAHSRLRHSRRLLFGVVAALLAAAAGVSRIGPLEADAGIATISFSMGIMNTILPRIGGESVSLTFMTGDLNRIGSHLALAFKGEPLPDGQGPWDTQLHRARLLASVWGSFLIGAVISAAMISHFGGWVLVLPVLILGALALFSGANEPEVRQGDSVVREAQRAG